jgi:rod shape-determining protein MreD
MNPYLTLLLLASIALLDTTLTPHLAFLSGQPQLMLLAVVSWSLLRGVRAGIIWAFIGGVMLDLLSGAPFGVITLPLLLVAYMSGLGEINVFRANYVLPIIVAALAVVVYNVVSLALRQLLGQPMPWDAAILRVVLPALLANLLALPVVFFPLRRLHQATGQPQMHW